MYNNNAENKKDDNMKVVKRDGATVDFNIEKIGTAVSKAFYALKKDVSLDEIINIQNIVESKIEDNVISIEEIQDLVEDTLLDLDYEDVFKEYVTYRRKRALSREFLSKSSRSSTLLTRFAEILWHVAAGQMVLSAPSVEASAAANCKTGCTSALTAITRLL